MLMVEVGEVALTEALLAATEIVLDQAEAAYDFVNASGSCGVLSC
jgi:hypothetical protein